MLDNSYILRYCTAIVNDGRHLPAMLLRRFRFPSHPLPVALPLLQLERRSLVPFLGVGHGHEERLGASNIRSQ